MRFLRTDRWRNAKRTALVGLALGSAALLPLALRAAEKTLPAPHELVVDFAKPCGTLRALHGVNNGPLAVNGRRGPDMTQYYRDAAIPCSRLHDSTHDLSLVVDIPLIFPLAHADPDDPANYLFGRTDEYIQGIIDAGGQIVYRLGTSIELSGKKYDTHPPKDFDRWAEVCVNIIRHYNEGWAEGFHHNIRYWQIWNEAENKNMWSGTFDQYLQMYSTTAQAIKRHDPAMKVGPGLVGVKAVAEKLLKHCRDRQVPLDFFSWHSYSDKPIKIKNNADSFRTMLDDFGFQKTEGLITEWHYMNGDWKRLRADADYREAKFSEINGPAGAAFNAATLLLLQDTSITMANHYLMLGDQMGDWGLFDRYGRPRKSYYAFKAFGRLLDTPQRVLCTGGNEADGLVIGAGLDADRKAAQILLANFESKSGHFRIQLHNLPWKTPSQVEVLAVDAVNNLDGIAKKRLTASEAALEVDCPAPMVLLIRLSP